MTGREDLELELKGLMLARTILEWRGFAAADLDRYSEEIERVRGRLQARQGEGRRRERAAA